MHNFGRRIRQVLLVLGIAAVIQLPSPSVAGATGPNAYTSNICGAGGCTINDDGPTGSLAQLQWLENRIAALGGTPAYIGLQEICLVQLFEFVDWIEGHTGANYQAILHANITGPAGDSACGGGAWSGPYGNAVLVVGPDNPAAAENAFSASTQYPGDEVRGYSCIVGNVFVVYTGCTAHMRSAKGPIPQSYPNAQFAEYYNNQIVPRATGFFAHPVWWGGDLYVPPSQITTAVPGFSYSANYEADRCAGALASWTFNNLAGSSNPKFDYVFRSGPGRSCGGDATLWPSSQTPMYPSPGWTVRLDHRIETGSWA